MSMLVIVSVIYYDIINRIKLSRVPQGDYFGLVREKATYFYVTRKDKSLGDSN